MIAPETSLTKSELAEFLSFALSLISISRDIISQKTGTAFTVEKKEDNSFVTEVDLAIEVALRDKITRAFPEHGIFGEELPAVNPDSPLQWVLDPIDGTLSFKHGIPLYGTLIALRQGETTLVGVIDLPGIGRTLAAAKGLGATCNGAPISIVDVPDIEAIASGQEIIATSDRANFLRSGKTENWEKLIASHPRVRTYSDCFGHALACLGVVGAMVDFNVCLWDILATEIIVTEAGGVFDIVETIHTPGKPTRYSIMAGKPCVVNWLQQFFPFEPAFSND